MAIRFILKYYCGVDSRKYLSLIIIYLVLMLCLIPVFSLMIKICLYFGEGKGNIKTQVVGFEDDRRFDERSLTS